MTDKSELKLAEGSDVSDAAVQFLDGYGDSIWVLRSPAGIEVELNSARRVRLVLAAIRAVDGDPEYLELVELRARISDAVNDICGLQPVESAMWLFDEFVRKHCEWSRDSMNRITKLGAYLTQLGYSGLEIERISTGNDIEGDHCCPQALKERLKLDELRAENEALAARCESLSNDLDEHKSWLEDAQRERDHFEELANNAGLT